MKERSLLIDSDLKIKSEIGHGTVVTIELELDKNEKPVGNQKLVAVNSKQT